MYGFILNCDAILFLSAPDNTCFLDLLLWYNQLSGYKIDFSEIRELIDNPRDRLKDVIEMGLGLTLLSSDMLQLKTFRTQRKQETGEEKLKPLV